MTESIEPDFSPTDIAAPPMANGELVFEAPWQGRVFGMARSLAQAGVFDWDEFRAYLIDALAEHDPSRPFDYYRHFLEALERLLTHRGLLSRDVVGRRFEALLTRPHSHDHPPR